MDFWMCFGFVYGILSDDRIHHTKFTKKRKSKICSAEVVRVPRPTRNSTKTRKRKNRLDGTHVIPSPVPHTKFSKINEIHEKGGQGWREGNVSFYIGVRGRDFGAERPAVEISYLPRLLSVACKPSACVPPQMGFAHLGFPGSPPPSPPLRKPGEKTRVGE